MTLTTFVNTYLGKKVDFEIRESVLSSEVNELWLKRYVSFIEKRMNRSLPEGLITEKHHIIPKCLFYSYKKANKKENYIILTVREHWIAHLILYKSFPECKSLATSAAFMGITRIDNFNSRQYSNLIKDWKMSASANAKKFNQERKRNAQYTENKRKASLKVYEDNPLLKQQISKKLKDLWKDEKFREKTVLAIQKVCSTEDFKIKCSNTQKARFNSNDGKKLKETISNNMLKTWSDENYKKNQINSHKDAWKDGDKRKRMQDGKMKAWENQQLRKKQSEIIKESYKNPAVRLNYAKGRLKIIMRSLEKNPTDEKLIQKKDRWLLEIKQLEVAV